MAHYYSKIQAPFRRAEGSKTITVGDYVDEYVGMLRNITWIGTEKIDGTNCNIVYDGNDVYYLGHTEKSTWNPEVEDWLNKKFVHNDSFIQMCEQQFGEKTVYFNGEIIGPKVQGNLYNLDDYEFILFDVKINNVYVNFGAVIDIAVLFGLKFAKLRVSGNLDKCVEFIKERNQFSFIYDKREIEGVVIRPEVELLKRNGERIIYKLKVKDLTGFAPITKQ